MSDEKSGYSGFTKLVVTPKLQFKYRVYQKSVPEPSSSGAARYSEVSTYPKVAAKAVYLYLWNSQKNIHIMF